MHNELYYLLLYKLVLWLLFPPALYDGLSFSARFHKYKQYMPHRPLYNPDKCCSDIPLRRLIPDMIAHFHRKASVPRPVPHGQPAADMRSHRFQMPARVFLQSSRLLHLLNTQSHFLYTNLNHSMHSESQPYNHCHKYHPHLYFH